jgi:hypothetical protein
MSIKYTFSIHVYLLNDFLKEVNETMKDFTGEEHNIRYGAEYATYSVEASAPVDDETLGKMKKIIQDVFEKDMKNNEFLKKLEIQVEVKLKSKVEIPDKE